MANPGLEASRHWEAVYANRPFEELSWHQARPEPSLAALEALDVPASAAVIDVGGGASLLVDALLARGFEDVTVLDAAASALAHAQGRLGADADRVRWLVADVTDWQPDRRFDVWHDRAVLHFLTEEAQRERYLAALRAALPAGGRVIIATFASDGPPRCSGLPVRRYDADDLVTLVGEGMELRWTARETHRTPDGRAQPFTWAGFVVSAPPGDR